MNLYVFVFSIWITLAFCFAEYYDTRRPLSIKLRKKYRVKDNSVFRKIIKFKDKENYPCNYFKIVPIYVYLFLSILCVFFIVVELLGKGIVSSLIPKRTFLLLTILFPVLYFLYLATVLLWWDIVDAKEFSEYKKNYPLEFVSWRKTLKTLKTQKLRKSRRKIKQKESKRE